MNKLMQRLLIFVCMVCVCAACSRESMEAHTQDTKTSTNIISKALVETEEVKGDVSTKGIEQKNPSKLAAKKIIPSALLFPVRLRKQLLPVRRQQKSRWFPRRNLRLPKGFLLCLPSLRRRFSLSLRYLCA